MINSYKDFKTFMVSLDSKPKLLLHSCCAPCSSHVLFLLKAYFDITVFFSNDNIYPQEEFYTRLEEVIRFCNEIDSGIQVLDEGYHSDEYYASVKGLERLGEKSERCYKCYALRMEKTAKKAKELAFDYFTTTLSISPHKNAGWINEIGQRLEEKYKIAYLYSDFKKENGYLHSVRLSEEYRLYRQDYCGCIFSMEERGNRK